jgi:hypothetical protein
MAMAGQQILAGKQTALMLHPAYSPQLTSCNFWLFPKLKMGLMSKCFVTHEDIQYSATACLSTTPKEVFHECFQEWPLFWSKCECAHRMYFKEE